MSHLAESAKRLESDGIFLGGPSQLFEHAGRTLLMTLLSQGLNPSSKVLDIGCGCLRGGYWLIHFLDRGCYCGIEPHRKMLQAGIDVILESGLADLKSPRFDHNADFNFEVFGDTFDFFVARSIWTHASKGQINAMLDGFLKTASSDAILLASYLKPTLLQREYTGFGWIGKSHESDDAGLVRHSLKWIQTACGARGLVASEVHDNLLNFGGQTWVCIRATSPQTATSTR